MAFIGKVVNMTGKKVKITEVKNRSFGKKFIVTEYLRNKLKSIRIFKTKREALRRKKRLMGR